ncbi:uncharacterized protein BcabD6B2_17230 [Babesia caballi]|uniref:Uncharacterized protein n=1 Tax=Babesia caballi TaxID=5871 RepID=A0AAV4LQM4_BABCB|nr:hypothetical protein, conserved [Babesia caballi]
MGFAGKLRTDAGGGLNIAYALNPFCGSPSDPLRQLSEQLGCLTKRTPSTLGDLLGFIWHLNGQLFKSRPKMIDLIDKFDKAFGLSNDLSSKFTTDAYSVLSVLWNHIAKLNPGSSSSSATGFSISLEAMAPAIPFLYQIFMMKDPNTLPGAIFDLTQHCHNLKHDEQTNEVKHLSPDGKAQCSHSSSNPADLWSLYNPVGDKAKYPNCSNKNCGGYLEPLAFTYGATFSPSSASAYLSWMAYLTDDLYAWLSEMRDDFNNISCEHCGSQCQQMKTCHATPQTACSCRSVVSCAGVLPVLYKYGFQFHDTTSLSGWKYENRRWSQGTPTVRSCRNFSQQLSNVLSPDAPLAKLLLTIDEFLYMFRFYFIYNLSSFWLCSLAILLYFIFYGIDVLHVRSHVHFPSTHGIPPIGLLTTGKVPALTKLTYNMP